MVLDTPFGTPFTPLNCCEPRTWNDDRGTNCASVWMVAFDGLFDTIFAHAACAAGGMGLTADGSNDAVARLYRSVMGHSTSQRSPRLMVSFDVMRQSSWKESPVK